jgi:MFS family permease
MANEMPAPRHMYPPERRARGIALVLFGAVFGAILGPAVFGPLLAGRELDRDALAGLWLAGGAFELVALALVAAPALWILRAGTARRQPVHRITDYLGRTSCTRTSP